MGTPEQRLETRCGESFFPEKNWGLFGQDLVLVWVRFPVRKAECWRPQSSVLCLRLLP